MKNISQILIIVFLIGICFNAYAKDKIFIFSTKAKNTSKDDLKLLENYFTDLLSKQKNLSVKTSMEETTTVITPGLNKAIKIGRKEDVDQVLMLWVTKVSGTYITNIKLVDVKKKSVIFSTSKKSKSVLEFEDLSKNVVNKMFGLEEKVKTVKKSKVEKKKKEKKVEIEREKRKPDDIRLSISTGIKSGLTLPLDSESSAMLSFEFPFIGAFVRLNDLVPNVVIDVELGYFSSSGDDFSIQSFAAAVYAGYSIALTDKLTFVPKLGGGYWLQSGDDTEYVTNPDINYPTANLSLELYYEIVKNLAICLDYRLMTVFSKDYTYIYHSPVLGVFYRF